jgi:hypothetical protein
MKKNKKYLHLLQKRSFWDDSLAQWHVSHDKLEQLYLVALAEELQSALPAT